MNEEKLIDFYELTMASSDFKQNQAEEKCYFDVFFRKSPGGSGYSIMGGLSEIINKVKNFRFDEADIDYLRSLGTFDEDFLTYLADFQFSGDIYAIPDGTPIFPGEPCITVYGNRIEAQLLETDLLNHFNHGSLISTVTRRITTAAKGRGVMEFGARRAQGASAAVIGAKYSYINGCVGTSCYETGKRYGVPLLGTMAHSQIQKYPTEYEAFLDYAKTFPNNAMFLVDTYDTLQSGVVNAIKVAKYYLIPNGYRLKGIRLDSGDLAYLSKQARTLLDEAGMMDATICVSNALDETLIRDLLDQGAPIDSFGVGENLITAKNSPVFGGVYKLVAVEEKGKTIPKIKISETAIKITNPGYKKCYRFFDKETGFALGDVIAMSDEEVLGQEYTLVNEQAPWQKKTLKDVEVRALQVPIFLGGNLVYQEPSVEETKAYAQTEFETMYEEVTRKNNPHQYYVDLSEQLRTLKQQLLEEHANVKSKKKRFF